MVNTAARGEFVRLDFGRSSHMLTIVHQSTHDHSAITFSAGWKTHYFRNYQTMLGKYLLPLCRGRPSLTQIDNTAHQVYPYPKTLRLLTEGIKLPFTNHVLRGAKYWGRIGSKDVTRIQLYRHLRSSKDLDGYTPNTTNTLSWRMRLRVQNHPPCVFFRRPEFFKVHITFL